VPQVNTKLQASLDRVYQDIEKLKSKYYRSLWALLLCS